MRQGFKITDAFKRRREEYLRADVTRKFNGVLHKCCGISENNHKIAYVVHRSVLGFPRIEQIERPQEVQLSETDDCVIVKDGVVYELTRRVE